MFELRFYILLVTK